MSVITVFCTTICYRYRWERKTAVILPIEKYTELIEDLQDLAVIAERRDEPSISHAQVVAELKKDDYL